MGRAAAQAVYNSEALDLQVKRWLSQTGEKIVQTQYFRYYLSPGAILAGQGRGDVASWKERPSHGTLQGLPDDFHSRKIPK